jgi:hypothetical protein
MQLPTIPKKFPTFAKFNQMSKKHKITAAGAVAAAAVVLTVTGLEATAGAGSATAASQTGASSATQHVKDMGAAVTAQPKAQQKTDLAAQAEKKAADTAAKKKAAVQANEAAKKKAAVQANERAKAKAAANRSEHRAPVAKKNVMKKSTHRHIAKHYGNNLDGWIRQSLDILHKKGIPASYEGIHRNIIRESSGNPHAINLWDINARNGIPSKGLLQVIDPTFQRYHVSGTSQNIYDPVANITAACNYAADRYGSMDNVNSAY